VDFTLNDEQQAIRDTCRDFATQEVKPLAEAMDATGDFPYALIHKMAELGLPFPQEYGGAGADFLSYCLAIEEISRADVSIGITMEAHTSLGATPFYPFGSEEQKEHYLVPLAQGKQLWAFGQLGAQAGNLLAFPHKSSVSLGAFLLSPAAGLDQFFSEPLALFARVRECSSRLLDGSGEHSKPGAGQ
jgi:butyryl-CoA dehydrogenase